MKDTIVILGNAESRSLYDHNRSDADVFVFNEAANTAYKGKRVTGVFQLHDPVIWKNPNNRNDPAHFEWLKNTGVTVYMQKHYDEIPASVEFPRDAVMYQIRNGRIMRGVGVSDNIREVSCTPAWSLAWAIQQGYKRIEIYGVELASDTEYAYQQGNFKFWVGVAIGRGIDVQIASGMFDAPQYGYEGEVEIPLSAFAERIAELQQKYHAAEMEYKAASIEIESRLSDFGKFDNTKDLLNAVTRLSHAGSAIHEIDGARQTNEYYQRKAEDMIKTAERFVFSRQEFEHNARQAQNNAASLQAQHNAIGGQLQMHHNAVVNSAKGSPKREKTLKAYRAALAEFFRVGNSVSGWTGSAGENMRYMARLDAGIKAAGGEKSEEAFRNA